MSDTHPPHPSTAMLARLGLYPARRDRQWALGHVLAGVLAVVVMILTALIRHTAPFGPVTRNINDQANQLLPFHAHLWDLLHGTTPSGWTFTWESGAGVPFLPDFAIYLSSPLAPLVALFPRDRLELAMFVLMVTKIALAAVAMSWLLRVLRPTGSAWLAALGGAAYATCGWTVDDASFMTMWLDGLIAFPLLCIVGEWARRHRRPVWSVVLIAVCWWANFYIAYMASVGAAIFVLARVVTCGWASPADERERAGTLRPTRADLHDVVGAFLRFAWRGALGVAAIGVIFVPMFLAVKSGQPATVASLHPASWASFASRLLPLTEAVNASPGWYVGSLCLLGAVALPWLSTVPLRVRVVYPTLLVLMALSWQWQPTQLLWNAGDTPNGGAFRCALVGAGWIVIMAWIAVGALPWARRAWLGSLATLTLIAGIGYLPNPHADVHPAAVVVLVVAVALAYLCSQLPSWQQRGSLLAVVGLVGAFLVEGVLTAVNTENLRDQAFWHSPVWRGVEERARPALDQARQAPGWPLYRTGVELGMGGNQPQLMGYPGLEYYSSVMPALTSRTLVGLGTKSSGWGRRVHTTHDPILDAMLGVNTWVKAPHPSAAPSVTPLTALPVVRVVPDEMPSTTSTGLSAPDAKTSVFGRRNEVLRRLLYSNGPTTFALPGVAPRPVPKGTATEKVTLPLTLTTTCHPGTLVQVSLPLLPSVLSTGTGPAVDNVPPGGPGRSRGSSGVTTLGTTTDGKVSVTVGKLPRESATGLLTSNPISCADQPLTDGLSAPRTAEVPVAGTGATQVQPVWEKLELRDNMITAVSTTPLEKSRVVVATTALEGWDCWAGGSPTDVEPVAGLLSVPMQGQRELRCTYRTPGLQAGSALTGFAVLATLAVGWWTRRRRSALAEVVPVATLPDDTPTVAETPTTAPSQPKTRLSPPPGDAHSITRGGQSGMRPE